MKRAAGVRGQFYPQSCIEIDGMIEKWNHILDQHLKDKNILALTPRAIISPHAGYIYSGFSANIAHRVLANSKPKRVIVIGPSHHVYIDGVSGSFMDSYETPCGDIKIDLEYLQLLKKSFSIGFSPKAHHLEHSTETQMPFIKHYNPDAKVIELIYGKESYHHLSKIVTYLLKDTQNTLVISTDLSHFYNLKEANTLDQICLEGVAKRDISIFERGCEACGIIGVKAIIESCNILGLKTKLLDYRTSADASGDENRVVGYMSALILK